MPHRVVMGENAESTKLRVVYDASARAYDSVRSLNECVTLVPCYRMNFGMSLSAIDSILLQ